MVQLPSIEGPNLQLRGWGFGAGRQPTPALVIVAMRTAPSYCQVNGSRCTLYAVDDTVVWQPLEGPSAPRRITSPAAPSAD